MNNRITIHIACKDRPSELALLLQSLRTQSLENWDLLIVDDASQIPLGQNEVLMKLINRVKLEKHKCKFIRNDVSLGVCQARNICIENDKFNNMYTARLDDDSILEPFCLEKLYLGIVKLNYDLIGGTIPICHSPYFERQNKYLKGFINEHKFNKKGDLIFNADECAYTYTKNDYLPTHQFRTYCVYKSKLNKIKYPKNLSKIGFREEGFFSMKAILKGYKLGICTGAIANHIQSTSGGCRDPEYPKFVQSDDKIFRDWLKNKFEKHGDFLKEYKKKYTKQVKK